MFVKQNIVRKLLIEAEHLGLPPTHKEVLKAVVSHFNLGPHPHRVFECLVEDLARIIAMCWFGVHGFPVRPLVATHSWQRNAHRQH